MMNKYTVTLTPSEMLLAAHAGIMRQVENVKLGRVPSHGVKQEHAWTRHIEGCMGEYALAKYLNIYWSGKGNLGDYDVGNMIDVRTAQKEHYRLILHPEDQDNRIFWLLCGIHGTYHVKGWILGERGKKQEYWADPAGGRPAYFVPDAALNAPEDYLNVRGE